MYLQFFLLIIIFCLVTSYFRATGLKVGTNKGCPKCFSQANIPFVHHRTDCFFLELLPPLCLVWGRHACCDYPPFCLRARDERAVPCPATDTLLLCTRSREARLRDEPSTAENKQGMECKGATTERKKERKKAQRGNGVKSRKWNRKRQKDNTLKWREDQQIGRETDRHEERNTYRKGKEKLRSPRGVMGEKIFACTNLVICALKFVFFFFKTPPGLRKK